MLEEILHLISLKILRISRDYNDGYQFNDELLDKTYRNFDIASDEEDVDYLIDPLITHNDKLLHQDNEIKPSLVDNQNDQPKR